MPLNHGKLPFFFQREDAKSNDCFDLAGVIKMAGHSALSAPHPFLGSRQGAGAVLY